MSFIVCYLLSEGLLTLPRNLYLTFLVEKNGALFLSCRQIPVPTSVGEKDSSQE
jgi:hypothetical protein